MAIRIVASRCFTNRPFAGNPARCACSARPPPSNGLRDVAREMNLSETGFPGSAGGMDRGWMFCGRVFRGRMAIICAGSRRRWKWISAATPHWPSAHVLWEDGHLPEGRQARFHTRSGLLTADRRGDWIELDFPAKIAVPAEAPAELLPAWELPRRSSWARMLRLPGGSDSEETVRALSPDYFTLRKVPVARGDRNGALVERRVRFRLALFRPAWAWMKTR